MKLGDHTNCSTFDELAITFFDEALALVNGHLAAEQHGFDLALYRLALVGGVIGVHVVRGGR